MRIKDIQYTKNPSGSIEPGGVFEIDNKKKFLSSVIRENNQTLKLILKTDKNEVSAYIRSKNAEEEKFLDFLEKELAEKFIGKSYDEIINTDFQIWENEKKNKAEVVNEPKHEAEFKNEEKHETEWKNEEKH